MSKLKVLFFFIPVKLKKYKVPVRLSSWHWVELYQEGCLEYLLNSLNAVYYSRKSGKKPQYFNKQIGTTKDNFPVKIEGIIWLKEKIPMEHSIKGKQLSKRIKTFLSLTGTSDSIK